MPPKIWFLKNMTHEAAGLFSGIAEDLKIPYAIADLHQGQPLPKVTRGQAVVILGGPDSANDATPKILSELDALRRFLRESIPCLGVCLGLQLLVKAGGGTVFRNPVKEIGFRGPDGAWFTIQKTAEGKKDPLLSGVPDVCKIFQLHGETVGLTPAMRCLARGSFCENQVVKIGERAYGIQGHVELSGAMFEDWVRKDGDLLQQDPAGLRRDFEASRVELEKSSVALFKNFLRISGLVG